MKFELNKDEVMKIIQWKKALPEIPDEFLDVFGKDFQFTFKFRPTGLGVVKIVQRDYDGAELNLTDYSNW
ncbi:hypothetical protein K8354_13275 [Polaribacter litorisediminis]|uniref:hypothetical protein n=1 Tax=Polaribacter litorisediminis TaxID=1908341 RepID=UPI001CC13D97|nr:hypothetical protein [Polaribacter litorisediminis]UAM97285.1 hypothetical protein K8354_13275 [Polaribacter litorisediminis]